jgi:hypothetical protein
VLFFKEYKPISLLMGFLVKQNSKLHLKLTPAALYDKRLKDFKNPVRAFSSCQRQQQVATVSIRSSF